MKTQVLLSSTLLLLTGCLLLLLTGCAGIEAGRKITPVRLQVTDRLQLPFRVEKCLLDQRTGTYYLMEQNRPNIHFYRNGQSINLIGGFGTDRTSFQKLSDIALDADGNLLALDIFARSVRKFSPDGKWIADIDLAGFNQPGRFCATAETDLIIYDAASQELSRLSTFDGKVMFTFGRFQVEGVFHISSAGDLIAVVSEDRIRTVLFTGMGLFLRDFSAQLVLDRFQNRFVYQDGALKLWQEDLALSFGWKDDEVKLFSGSTAILIVHNDTVVTVLPTYQGSD